MIPRIWLVEPDIYRITNRIHVSLVRPGDRTSYKQPIRTLCGSTIKWGYVFYGHIGYFKDRMMCQRCKKRAMK